MADDSGIDPRYAAQFQRGYDPAQHPVAPPAPPARDPASPVRLPGGPAATAVRIPEHPVPVVRPPAADVPAPAAELVVPAPVVETEDEPAPRRSWAEWLLLGLAGVLFLGAYATLSAHLEYQNQGSGPGPLDMVTAILGSTMPGPFFVGGVVALLLWIALRAAGRSGR